MGSNVCDFEPRTAFVVELISDVLASAPDRRVLVLSDRKSQLQHVHDLLVAKGIAVGFYWEGMDIPELDTLVLASPKTDVVQSCGRITRFRPDAATTTNNPLVIDVVDTFAGIFVAQSRYCYMMSPPPKVVVRFPSPANAGSIVYQDNAKNCFTFDAKETACSKDAIAQPINVEDFKGEMSDSPKDIVADSSKDAVEDSSKDAAADSSKDAAADSPKDAATDSPKDVVAADSPKDAATDAVSDSPKDVVTGIDDVVGEMKSVSFRGAPALIDVPRMMGSRRFDACKVASAELDAGLLPLVVARTLSDGKTELVRIFKSSSTS
eukprot:gene8432-biopygen3774